MNMIGRVISFLAFTALCVAGAVAAVMETITGTGTWTTSKFSVVAGGALACKRARY
ncbi:MAG: hypothetical protein PHY50_07155 [Sideroxydans sp.]|nr:hypothetical protein [Sideroxydans sp.]